MDWTTTQRNMQRSQLQIFGNTNKTMCWTLVSIPQVEWHSLHLSEQGRSFWHLPLSAQTNRQTVSVFFSSPYITIVLVVSSVTNWLPHASTADRAVAVALVMSSFHGKLHSTVLLKNTRQALSLGIQTTETRHILPVVSPQHKVIPTEHCLKQLVLSCLSNFSCASPMALTA